MSKLNSVIASMATAKLNELIHKYYPNKPLAFFDCRSWNFPNRTEAANTILSRFLIVLEILFQWQQEVYIVIRNYLIKIKMIK